jgi:hypothetical protein
VLPDSSLQDRKALRQRVTFYSSARPTCRRKDEAPRGGRCRKSSSFTFLKRHKQPDEKNRSHRQADSVPNRIVTALGMILAKAISELRFGQVVWCFPIAVALHFAEEWLAGFPAWVRTHVAPRYTDRDWIRVHGSSLLLAIVFTFLVTRQTNRYTAGVFFAACLSPIVYNVLFHAAASAWSRSYCPGLVSAAVLYPVLFWMVATAGKREMLLNACSLVIAFLAGGIIHACDVGVNVFQLNRFLNQQP